ncbi:MAG: hypothetical protein WB948_11065 [Desulfobaccales bacterium]
MSIGSRLEPGRAAGALLKPSAVGISRAAGARTHGIGPAVSIGTTLEPGATPGALLKPSAVGISRAAGARTHGIGPAVGIGTALEPGAAAEPLSGHGAVITRSLGSAIVRRPPWGSNIPGHVGAAASVSGSHDVGSGCRCVSIGPTPTRRKDVGGAASVTAAVAGAAAVTAAAGT